MRIDRIAGSRYMLFPEFEIVFPSSGVVLVTGDNGEGKSALVEVAPSALYNKTLRGTPWWQDGETSRVEISAGEFEVQRERRKAENWMQWRRGDTKLSEYENATKAQQALDPEIVALGTWRRTSVFTSGQIEGKGLTTEKDGGRKRLIEAVLGLDRFDAAAGIVREQLGQARGLLDKAEHAREIADTKYQAEEKRKDETAEQRRALRSPDSRPDGGELLRLGDALKSLKNELATLRSDARELDRADAKIQAQIDKLAADKEMLEGDNCPTCGQTIPEVLRKELDDLLAAARKKAKAIAREAAEELEIVNAQIEELEETIDGNTKKRDQLSREVADYDRFKSRKEQLEEIIRDATLQSTKWLTERSNNAAKIEKVIKEVETLAACERVLGLKGVRAHVLGDMLAGLETIANKWLARMPWRDQIISLRIRPWREKARGGVTDDLTIEVLGAGGGFGYDACSVGQRRRIDVALLIGLARISHAAHGLTDGTLFFDEVFDILDPVGVEAVCDALIDLSRDRCVVVISHSETVRRLLQPTMHLQVEQGRIYEL